MRRAAPLSAARLSLVAAAWLAGLAHPQVCDAADGPHAAVWPRPRSFRVSGALVPLDAQFHVRPADAASRAAHWGHGSVSAAKDGGDRVASGRGDGKTRVAADRRS
jgi:hypothetical protein